MAEPTPLREVFEPHEGFYVRVLHKDGGTRTWHRRGCKDDAYCWHSDTSWFGWTWEQVVESADRMWLSTNVDTWEEI